MRKPALILILILLIPFTTHTNAASVYIAKDSRTYHCDRNCPELNTDNVIEFNSPEEADALGAIPCGHCKLTTGKLNYNVKNVLPNPVITNGSLGEFRHGTFPSPPLGEYTHVGVDLVAPCGSNVYTFADGKVKDVIDSKNDKAYKTLGYMVLIQHPASLIGKKFYTLYLHMQGPPEVKIGDQVQGGSTVIGKVGDTGKAFGCHTHFEIRYFPERFSRWGNIYGPGDQRDSVYFKQNWENPIKFFKKYPKGITISKKQEVGSNTFYITMKEGSVINGAIIPSLVKFNSKYGDIDVNINTISSFKEGILILNNQSRLKGNFKQRNITIKTSYTDFNIAISEIAALSTEVTATPRQETSVSTQNVMTPRKEKSVSTKNIKFQGNKLSRDNAKKSLKNLVITKRWCAFPGNCSGSSINIPNVYGFYLEASSAGIDVSRETLISYLSCLESKGLVKNLSVKKGRGKGFQGWDAWFETTTTGEPWQLTGKGQKYLSDNLDYSFQVDVNKITGIQFSNEDTVAKVYFDATIKHTDNPFGNCFEVYFDVQNLLNEPYAIFELFDDGWRFKKWYSGGVLKERQQTSTKQLGKKEHRYIKDNKFTAINNPRVVMETNYGTFTIELYPKAAPKTVENFLKYVRSGFYDGTIFHRVIEGFMIQGGGLTNNMQKKPTRPPIINESENGPSNLYGTVAMARIDTPHSATSQFFVNTVDNTYLNHRGKSTKDWGYCVFGIIEDGMDVIHTIENLPTTTKGKYQDLPTNQVIITKAIVKNDNQQSTSAKSGNNEISDLSDKISSSVIATNTSNIYHKSNCPELGTEGLIEFASSKEARKSGGVPCGNCNP
ncbi:MAG: peptidylprolyl isomerase [Candidatus Scalindua sp.]